MFAQVIGLTTSVIAAQRENVAKISLISYLRIPIAFFFDIFFFDKPILIN